MPLPEEVLRWYYKTELLLKERFDIDTTRKEDMGRIRAVQTKVLTLRDDPQKVESVKKAYLDEPDRKKKKEIRAKLTPSEMRPLAFGEELKSHQLPKTQIFFDESPYTVTEQFAFMKRSDDGQSYKTDIPEYEEGYHPWMLENQNTFHVKNVDGRLVMESSLSEDELMHIYQEAKDGRIFVNEANGDIRSQNGSGMFLSVDKNGAPLLADLEISKVKDLGKEKVKAFYAKHPELLEVSADSIEVDTAARCEMTAVSLSEKPTLLNDRIYYSLQDLHNQSGVGSNEEEHDRLIYDKQFWWEMHNGKKPIDFARFREINGRIPDLISAELGVRPSFTSGEYLQNCFLSENGQLRPLFPDRRTLMTEDAMVVGNTVKCRMAEAMNNGGFLFCREDPEQPGKYDSALITYNDNAEPMLVKTPAERPRQPRFFGWKKFWNGINHKWFGRELNDYRLRSQLFNSAKQELPDAVRALNAEEMPPKKREEKKLSPEKQARKEKLAQMTPEQQLSYQVAEATLEKLRHSAMPKIFLAALDQTPEDIQRTEKFQAYMKTQEVKDWIQKMHEGETVNYNQLSDNCLKFEIVNYADEKKAPSDVPKAPSAGKETEKKISTDPVKSGP